MKGDYTKKYCIIGGGVIGIGMAKCFTQSEIPFDLVESSNDFGGNWNYKGSSSRMYDSVHLITSKVNTQFSDFPMPADFPIYPSYKQFFSYLLQVIDHYKLRDHAEFNLEVKTLEPIGEFWRVTLSNGEERLYKGIVLCTGLLRERRMPNFPGHFDGEIIHSLDYRSSKQVEGKRVLVVGGGNSGCDIAVDAIRGAEKTFLSMRRGYHFIPKFTNGKPTQDWLAEIAPTFENQTEFWNHVKKVFKMSGYDGTDFGLPTPDHDIQQAHPVLNSLVLYYIGHGDILAKPNIKELKSKSVVFEDGSEEEVDIIIYATGFLVSFPFLSETVLRSDPQFSQLFARIFHRDYDNILFCGYVSSPSGIGNFSNTLGRLASAYFLSMEKNTKAFQIFQKLKQGPSPDLGNKMYIHTERHYLEEDLWKVIKFANGLRAKFEEDL
jgi:thioredoxin reductase